jgi:hypothetical protein
MLIKNVTLGADPELFLQNEIELISAEGLLGGTKEAPKNIPGYPGFFIQEDNVMAEFNIPPTDNSEEFIDNIEIMKDYIEMNAVIHSATISKLASGEFNPIYLETEQAAQFGCDPDINVYTKRKNKVEVPNGNTLRCCGGHIHVGYDNHTKATSAALIFAMDITLGLTSLNLDNDDRRRELYGNAGSFRFKNYGVEYRTLSNFWIFSKKTIQWAWDGTIAAIELVNSGLIEQLVKEFSLKIKECIDTNNKKLAMELLLEINNVIKTKTICAESLDTQGIALKK